jgi:hypothetical protein
VALIGMIVIILAATSYVVHSTVPGDSLTARHDVAAVTGAELAVTSARHSAPRRITAAAKQLQQFPTGTVTAKTVLILIHIHISLLFHTYWSVSAHWQFMSDRVETFRIGFYFHEKSFGS